MRQALVVGMGGFLGAIARYALSGLVQSRLGFAVFPIGTLVVNVLGSLGIGVLIQRFQAGWLISPEIRSFFLVGLLGAFTTFSTFSHETVALAESGRMVQAAGNAALSLGLCLAAVWAGKTIAMTFWG